MPKSESEEPMLTFKLSDETEFRCSVCQNPVASVGNGRIVVVGMPDLIAAFRDHLARYHTKEDVSRATDRIAREGNRVGKYPPYRASALDEWLKRHRKRA